MAKRYDNDFDAEGFVENFRAKDYPAAPSAATDDKRQVEPPADDEAPVRKENKIKTAVRKGKPTESADDYKATFIDDLKYRFPESGWSQVKIHPELKAKIIFLETVCRSHRANLSTFINNVLEQHFRDYEAQITELKKNITKMSNSPSSPFMEKVSGAISGGLSEVLDRQSPSLAAARKYQERFLSNNRLADNKRVYISAELHTFLTRMVSAVGKEKTSVGNYVTEIVREHLERNRDSINAIYLTNTQPLF